MKKKTPAAHALFPLVSSLLASAALLGCAAGAGSGAGSTTKPARASEPARDPASAAGDGSGIRFIEDDYPRAVAAARAQHKPLFIDAWAPWCHTCVSMRAYVFPDARLRARAGELVWLSIDTERPENAAFVAAHPMHSWPTLYVVDASAAAERVAFVWPSSATAVELDALLEEVTSALGGGAAGTGAAAAFSRGNQATAGGRGDEAIAEYRAALSAAGADWPRRANAVEALIERLTEKKDERSCATLADEEAPRLCGGTSRAMVALIGLECAGHLVDDKSGDEAAREGARAIMARLVAVVRAMAMDAREPLMPDDRSQLFEGLVSALRDEKREPEALEAAAAWAGFLEREAEKAATAGARAVYDAHRLSAYLALGEPARALPMLAQSERDLPGDYNPPARLCRAYLALHRSDDALAAIERALARGYGPRRLRLHAQKAEVLEAKGDPRAAALALRAAIAEAAALALPGYYGKFVHELEARAAALEARAAK